MSKKTKKVERISTEEFDAKFDAGEDISEHLDFANSRVLAAGEDGALSARPQKVNVDFPQWVVGALDRAAEHRGVPRQSLIKMWLVERLEREGRTA